MLRVWLIRIEKFEKVLATLLFVIMAVLIVIDSLTNQVFKISYPFIQKLSVYAMIWMSFLSLGLVATKYSKIEKILWGSLCLVLCYFSMDLIMEAKTTGQKNTTTGIMFWVLQLVVPYAFFSTGIKQLGSIK